MTEVDRLLDEAFSALDGKMRIEIEERIFNNKSQTSIVISHNVDTVKKADRILVLEKGKIVAYDTHVNLMKTCRSYVELFYEMEVESGAKE